MPIELRSVAVPDFGLPLERPAIPAATYERRCREAHRRAGTDWLCVYADREHAANMAFLTGFEPRFEEALLLLGSGDRRILVVGNECLSYAPVAGLPGLTVLLCQAFSLMAQDRTEKPSLEAVLREAGLKAGDSVGIVGWKYLEPEEWTGPGDGFLVPVTLLGALHRVVGGGGRLTEATPVLMNPADGLRSVIDADQIAAFEWGAARASAAVWRVIGGIREGDAELEAAARMGYAGEPLTCNVMLSSNDRNGPVIGLASPGGRRLRRGDGVTCAVGYWGGLSARCGLLTDHDEAFLKVAAAYFEGILAWYETAGIGVAGGAVHDAVHAAMARGGLRPALNPGHLTSFDEWSHTPVRPGSADRIASGMAFQVDIIPVPMPDGWILNCEDAVTFADAALRAELEARHPAVAARIAARRAFVGEALGVALDESVLPLSSTPLCLPPFWLAADRLLARA